MGRLAIIGRLHCFGGMNKGNNFLSSVCCSIAFSLRMQLIYPELVQYDEHVFCSGMLKCFADAAALHPVLVFRYLYKNNLVSLESDVFEDLPKLEQL